MTIKKKKSGVMFFKRRSNKNQEQEFEGYPIVKKYKYLGVYIDEKLNWNDQIEHIQSKIDKAMKILQMLKWKNASLWK